MGEEAPPAKFRAGYSAVVSAHPAHLGPWVPALEPHRRTRRVFKETYYLENLQKEERKKRSWGWGERVGSGWVTRLHLVRTRKTQ